jgi:hypothetical protein
MLDPEKPTFTPDWSTKFNHLCRKFRLLNAWDVLRACAKINSEMFWEGGCNSTRANTGA